MSTGCMKHRAAVGRPCKTSLPMICNDGQESRKETCGYPSPSPEHILSASQCGVYSPPAARNQGQSGRLSSALARKAEPAGRPQAIPVSPALPEPAQLAARKYTPHGQRPGTKKCNFQHVTKARLSEDGSGFVVTRAVVCACHRKAVRCWTRRGTRAGEAMGGAGRVTVGKEGWSGRRTPRPVSSTASSAYGTERVRPRRGHCRQPPCSATCYISALSERRVCRQPTNT